MFMTMIPIYSCYDTLTRKETTTAKYCQINENNENNETTISWFLLHSRMYGYPFLFIFVDKRKEIKIQYN